MSGYKPVRSSSPTREPFQNEETHELPERKDANADEEQNERLLQKDGEDDDDDIEAPQSRPRPFYERRPVLLVGVLTLLGLVLMVALVILMRVYFQSRPARTDSVEFRRPSSDYILDQDWDYGAPSQVREYNWVLENVEANPDGVYRTIVTINGKFPGELIRANEGDTIVVNVENRLVNATSIHWHGLLQNGSSWMDGTPGVTQCPIAPGKTFHYQFKVEGQSGTCMWSWSRSFIRNRKLTRSRLLPRSPSSSGTRWSGGTNSHSLSVREDFAAHTLPVGPCHHAVRLVL
jgi:hypothetical protein